MKSYHKYFRQSLWQLGVIIQWDWQIKTPVSICCFFKGWLHCLARLQVHVYSNHALYQKSERSRVHGYYCTGWLTVKYVHGPQCWRLIDQIQTIALLKNGHIATYIHNHCWPSTLVILTILYDNNRGSWMATWSHICDRESDGLFCEVTVYGGQYTHARGRLARTGGCS